MRIALDLDGCIRDLMSSLVYTYKLYFPYHKVLPITKWGLEDSFPIGKDITQWGFHEHANEVFFENATAIPLAYQGIQKLYEAGHELTLLTYQNIDTFLPTAKWVDQGLVKYFKEIRIMINDTSKLGSGKEDTDYDLYLDDSPGNIKKYLEKCKSVICMNQPWNINESLECGRVNNMMEFYNYVVFREDYLNGNIS